VTARGRLNSCRVVFVDGYVMITSRNAIKRTIRSPCADGCLYQQGLIAEPCGNCPLAEKEAA
jgi:hypothetical protein